MTACAGLARADDAANPPARYTECDAAVRDRPSLSHRVFPTATFTMVDQVIGSDREGPLKIRVGREHLRLSKTVDLTVYLGGCETYATSYEFRLAEAAPIDADQAYWLSRGAELIGRIEPGNRDSVVSLKRLRQALTERAKRSHGLPLPIEGLEGELDKTGFGTTYGLEVRKAKGATFLTLHYWIGL